MTNLARLVEKFPIHLPFEPFAVILFRWWGVLRYCTARAWYEWYEFAVG